MAQTPESGELKEITFKRLESKLEAHLVVERLLNYKSFPLSNPNRLVIDLFQVTKFSCNSYIEVIDLGIKSIRVAKNRPDVIRVVFDLAEKAPFYKIKETSKGLVAVFWFGEEKKEKVAEAAPPKLEKEIAKPEEVEKKEEIEKPMEKTPPILPPEIIEQEEEMTFSIGLNSGFCFMHASRFQDIYGNSSPFTGVETVFKFPLRKKEYIGVSLSFKFISDKGLSSYEKSKLEITPVTFSALYSRQYGLFYPYIGVGADYLNYSENSPETFDKPIYSSKTWGLHFEAGTYIYLTSFLSFKLFAKYQSARLKENGTDINLGGNVYGFGLAYHFNLKI